MFFLGSKPQLFIVFPLQRSLISCCQRQNTTGLVVMLIKFVKCMYNKLQPYGIDYSKCYTGNTFWTCIKHLSHIYLNSALNTLNSQIDWDCWTFRKECSTVLAIYIHIYVVRKHILTLCLPGVYTFGYTS